MAKVVILSGSGLSAESGISTFRGSGGLWEEYDVSVICQADSLDKNEDLTIEFYDKRRAELEEKQPNYAHHCLSELKKKYPQDIALITQNVDDLFEKSGLKSNQDLIHLHGFLTQVRCRNTQCNAHYDISYQKLHNFHQGLCPKCHSKLRPDIVFFGEAAPMYAQLEYEFRDCDFFVVIGTSGNVIGVNAMAQFTDYSILNNLEASEAIEAHLFSKVMYMKATEAIAEIVEEIETYLGK